MKKKTEPNSNYFFLLKLKIMFYLGYGLLQKVLKLHQLRATELKH